MTVLARFLPEMWADAAISWAVKLRAWWMVE
jgi:hypothetical protein